MRNIIRPLTYAVMLAGSFSSFGSTSIQYDHRVQLSINSSSFIDFVPQGNSLTVQHGSIIWDNAGDNWVYTPNNNFKGIDGFSYYDAQNNLKAVRIEVAIKGNSASIAIDPGSHYQNYSRIVPLTNGDFLVSWNEHLNSYDTVMFQRFNALGEAVTAKTEVHDVFRNQSEPVAGFLPGGGYVLAWREIDDIYARIYDSNNVGGTTFRVNHAVAGIQSDPAIATLANGDFVIAFDGNNQFTANIYAPNGTIKQQNLELPVTIGGLRTEINLKPLDSGFMAMGSTDRYIFTRTFDNNGVATNPMVVVSDGAFDASQHKQVTMARLSDGRYMVGWTATQGQDGSLWSVMGRIYNADHTPVTNEFLINQYADNNQLALGLQVTHDGQFIAIWQSDAADGNGWGIMARRYDRDGVALSEEFRITSQWMGDQIQPDITMLQDGQIALSYTDNNQLKVGMLTPGSDNEDIFQGDGEDNIFIGSGGVNKVYAAGGDDIIFNGTYAWGRSGDDTFYGGGLLQYGGTGNDDFYIGPGDSVINGEQDYDVVFFNGNFSDYLIEYKTDGRILVDDLRPGTPDGSRNTLKNIEAIEFADHRISTEAAATPWIHMVQTATNTYVAIDFNDLTQGSVTQSPQQGTLTWDSVNSNYVYAPNLDYKGLDSFVYQDGAGGQVTVRVEVGMLGNSATLEVQAGTHHQYYSRVTPLTNGDFVVTWYEQVNGYDTVMFQSFNALGETLVGATEVHDVNRSQSEPVVSATANGGFVIAWVELDDIYAKIYNSNNVGTAFRVNAFTAGIQSDPAITLLANGDFLIAWDAENSNRFYANLYTPAGTKSRQNIQLSNNIGGFHQEVNVKALPDGGFMAMGSTDKFIIKRRFSHTGDAINSTSIVNQTDTYKAIQHKQVTLATLPDGTYMVGWTATQGQNGSLWSVMGRIYNAQDQAITNEFLINQYANNNQLGMGVVATNSGDFLTVWQSDGGDGNGWGISGRLFDSNGVAQGDELSIVGDTLGNQFQPDLNRLNNGQLVLSYTDFSSGYGQVKVAMLSLGEGNDDILAGNAQNNVLIGGDGYNTIEGGAGNDTIYDAGNGNGGDGDDAFFHRAAVAGGASIDGGAGSDSIEFAGLYQDYTVTDNVDGSHTVVDVRSGSPDGTVLLRNVETLVFSDQSVNL